MIYVTGDIHGEIDIKKFNTSKFPEGKDLTREDYVIICGDFGMPWWRKGNKWYDKEVYWLNWLNDKPWTTLFVDGNHENFDLLNAVPEVEMFGSRVGKVCENIFHLKRGMIYQIDDKKILALGGATSIDKDRRIVDERRYGIKLWWEEELWTREEENRCFDNMDEVLCAVDYIISHTAPMSVLLNDFHFAYLHPCPVSRMLDEVMNRMSFKKWYFGHMHTDETRGKFNALYDRIVEVK